MTSPAPDFHPGSFRDPEGRVFFHEGRVFRTLSPKAAERMKRLDADGTFKRLADQGFLVPTRVVPGAEAGLEPARFEQAVLEQEKLPLITYPYEWSFGLLKDAALFTLDFLETALGSGLTLKDATPFNVALWKNRPVFFDTLSLDIYEEGRPWDGYSQFCREFLFPLLLTSTTGIAFQPWLRGELNGLKVQDLSRLLGYGRLRRGALTHVHIQAWLERWIAKKGDVDLRQRFNKANFSKATVLKLIGKLRKLVRGLRAPSGGTLWAGYEETHSYSAEDDRKKSDFIAAAAERENVWIDLGCNKGRYTMVAAKEARLAVGLDLDPCAVDAFYDRIRGTGGTPFYPLVCDLMNPSPSLGWRLRERPSLLERVRGDSFLALALVHHLCIGANVPLPEFVALLKTFGKGGVVEWVDKKDSMVKRLLRNREDVFSDYTWETFCSLLEGDFVVKEVCETHGGSRRLCRVTPKAAPQATPKERP